MKHVIIIYSVGFAGAVFQCRPSNRLLKTVTRPFKSMLKLFNLNTGLKSGKNSHFLFYALCILI